MTDKRPHQGMIRLSVLGLIQAGASIALVLFGSAIFQTLGFEFSALSAVSLSLLTGLDGALLERSSQFSQNIRRATARSLLLGLTPLAVSAASLYWLPNCALVDGLILYIEIAVPSALLGSGFGLTFRLALMRKRGSVTMFLLFWIITLILSLLPGYWNVQLFTYGWQYGYFPGLVWDQALTLKLPYLWFRLSNLVWVSFFLILAFELHFSHRRKLRYGVSAFMLLAGLGLYAGRDLLGITTSHELVRETLSKQIYLGHQTWLYYAPNSLAQFQLDALERRVPIWLTSIEQTFELRRDAQPTYIYVYPDARSLEHFVGTRSASITKPWLHEVHISEGALSSLKHELVHAELSQIGNFPFDASWATGLTEGAAVACELPQHALFTTSELAAQILEMRLASGVQGIMQFTGFADANPRTAYILAGSFVTFLLHRYGAAPFKEVYHTLNYDNAYHHSLPQLELEWKRWLSAYTIPLTSQDSVRLQLAYGGGSIMGVPCLRRLGKLERATSTAFDLDNYGDAFRSSREAFREGHRASDAWSMALALIMLGRMDDARFFLDTVAVPKKELMLGVQLGDVAWMNGEFQVASDYYTPLRLACVDPSSYFASYERNALLSDSSLRGPFQAYLRIAYRRTAPDYAKLLAIVDTMQASHHSVAGFDRVAMLLRYLKIRLLAHEKDFDAISQIEPVPTSLVVISDTLTADSAMTQNGLTEEDSLAISLIERQMWQYRAPRQDLEYIAPTKYRLVYRKERKAAEAEVTPTNEAAADN